MHEQAILVYLEKVTEIYMGNFQVSLLINTDFLNWLSPRKRKI